MMYGNYANGYSYSPDRSKDKVEPTAYKTQFLGANGSRQGGYYSSGKNWMNWKESPAGGHRSGSGMWIKD